MRTQLMVAVLIIASACATPTRTRLTDRTAPTLDATARALPPPASRSILIVTEATLHGLSPELATAVRPASASPDGLAAMPDFWASLDAVSASLERRLFDEGWEPVSQPVLARLATQHRTALELRDLTLRGRVTLADVALVLGRASTAELILVMQQWSVGFAPERVLPAGANPVCPMQGLLEVVAYDRSGLVVWQGLSDVRATDLVQLSVMEGATTMVNPAGWACAGPCTACGPVGPGAWRSTAVASLADAASREIAKALAPASARR